MNPSQVSHADNGHTQPAHAALRRSRPRPLRPSCWF
jgi:hypothetical protein